MRVSLSLRLLLSLCLATTFIACGEDGVQNNGGGGFQFNNGTGDETKDTPIDSPTDSTVTPPDATPDVPPSDGSPDTPPTTGCQTNDDCRRSEVCCQDLSNNKACVPTDDCAFGGLCNSDAQCSGANETCCDLSSLGVADSICTDQCITDPMDATPDLEQDEQPDQPIEVDAGPDTACATNAECGGNLLCCVDQTGSQSCQSSCLYGGSCATDVECSGAGEVCCDISQFGIPNTPDNVCTDQCPNMNGGGGGGACMSNSECANTEVCCPSFQGNSCVQTDMCRLGGGVCSVDSDCRNGQSCCGQGNFKICRDQCRF